MTAHGTRNGTPRLPVAPLRDAFLASGRSADEVCLAIGWIDDRPTRARRGQPVVPDRTRLRRALGLVPSHTARKTVIRASTIGTDRAWLIATAINRDLVEIYPALLEQDDIPCKHCGAPLWTATADLTCGFCVEERELAAT